MCGDTVLTIWELDASIRDWLHSMYSVGLRERSPVQPYEKTLVVFGHFHANTAAGQLLWTMYVRYQVLSCSLPA